MSIINIGRKINTEKSKDRVQEVKGVSASNGGDREAGELLRALGEAWGLICAALGMTSSGIHSAIGGISRNAASSQNLNK